MRPAVVSRATCWIGVSAYRTNSLPSQSSAFFVCRNGHRTSNRSSHPLSSIAFSRSAPTSHPFFPVWSVTSGVSAAGVSLAPSMRRVLDDPARGVA